MLPKINAAVTFTHWHFDSYFRITLEKEGEDGCIEEKYFYFVIIQLLTELLLVDTFELTH